MEPYSLTHAACVPIAFVGTVLGPFYTHDPKRDADTIGPSFQAIADLDVEQAAKDWPFVKAPVAQEALGEMQEGLDDEHSGAPLAKEYRRLFIGPEHKPVPPWGSVYTDSDQVMFGKTALDLHDWLRRNGIAVKKGDADLPDDHIGTMLEIMAWIAQNKPELLEEYLCDHFLTWAPHYLEEFEQEAKHPFYHGLALLTLESLQGIQRMFGLTVITPRFYR
ncbi:MAG: molecular chaperone TorD family protein [Eggerthellaceae bacterium]|jgi:TorA maturation chaperone TorD